MSEDLENMFRPPFHLRPKIREISENLFKEIEVKTKDLGWCILAHGSMERDLDILATPWTDEACTTQELVEIIRLTFAEFVKGKCYKSAVCVKKPFGRKAYNLYALTNEEDLIVSCTAGAFPFIDLSIIDLRCHLEEEVISNAR